jgi:predicted transcriptional regulator of viral defense system
LYYWNETAYSLGKTTVLIDNASIPIYDLEKTICDVIRHRNKMGLDVMKEILKNYVKRKDRNLNRLERYARQLNIQNKVNVIIELLL